MGARLRDVRIAVVATVPSFIWSQLQEQLRYLTAEGAIVTVITSEGEAARLIRSIPGVSVNLLEIRRKISLFRDFKSILSLISWYRSASFQIVHSTTPKAGLLSAIAARVAGTPIRLHTFTGQPWVTMLGPRRWIAMLSDKIIGFLNTYCLVDSLSQRNFMVTSGVLKQSETIVIANGSLAGVNLERFDSRRYSESQKQQLKYTLGIPDDAGVILFVGRIHPDKGVTVLLDAFRMLCKSGNNAHLIIVGEIDKSSGAGSTISLDKYKDVPGVHWVGHSPAPEEYMSIADVLCLPSFREGFGTVVAEAAAMGVPVVGSNIYGLSDSIENNVTGTLVEAGNAVAVFCALKELLENNELRHCMSNAARARAQSQFSAKKVNDELIRYYCKMLGNVK